MLNNEEWQATVRIKKVAQNDISYSLDIELSNRARMHFSNTILYIPKNGCTPFLFSLSFISSSSSLVWHMSRVCCSVPPSSFAAPVTPVTPVNMSNMRFCPNDKWFRSPMNIVI